MNKFPRKALIAVGIAAAFIVPIVYVLTPVPLPARTPPAGLQAGAGHAQIEVAEFGPAWHERVISDSVEPEPSAAAFETAAPDTLFWHAWYRAPVRGTCHIDAKISGGGAVFVDHRDAMIVRRCSGDHGRTAAATTATGTVALAAGWHEISGDVGACAPVELHATVALSIRAPGASAAVSMAPYWPTSAAK